MRRQDVSPKEAGEPSAQSEEAREAHRTKQPYASELDDRELEHAHKEQRPVEPSAAPDHPKPKDRSP